MPYYEKCFNLTTESYLNVNLSGICFALIETSICSSNPCDDRERCYANGLTYLCVCYNSNEGKNCEKGKYNWNSSRQSFKRASMSFQVINVQVYRLINNIVVNVYLSILELQVYSQV